MNLRDIALAGREALDAYHQFDWPIPGREISCWEAGVTCVFTWEGLDFEVLCRKSRDVAAMDPGAAGLTPWFGSTTAKQNGWRAFVLKVLSLRSQYVPETDWKARAEAAEAKLLAVRGCL